MLEPILYFSGTILVTLIVAVLLCRHCVAHRRRPSWGTVVASPVIANFISFFGMAFYDEGWHLFTRDAWSEPKGGWFAALIVLTVITVFCILPALGVAVYYERRSRNDEKRVVS